MLAQVNVARKAGDLSAARKALEELKAQSKQRYVPALYFAAIHTGFGDSKVGISWLGTAYREHYDYLVYLDVDPMADSLLESVFPTITPKARFNALAWRVLNWGDCRFRIGFSCYYSCY